MCSHADLASRPVAAGGTRAWIVRRVMLAMLGLVVAGWGCAETYQAAGGTAPRAARTPEGELAALRQQQEALRHQVEQVTRSLEALEQSLGTAEGRIAMNLSSIEKLHGRVSRLSEGPSVVGEPLEEPPPSTAGPTEGAASLRTRYAKAYSDFKVGEYISAIEEFRGFVEHHPQSRLADNAQYWIAESYLALKDYHRALDEFRRVERNYPNGNKVPVSILRSGQTLYVLEDTRGFVRELKRLIQLFPRDRAAQVAAESIAELGGQ